MRSTLIVAVGLAGMGSAILLGQGCGQTNAYRDQAQQQNSAEAEARAKMLAPVLGTYCGKMHLIKSGFELDVKIAIERGEDNVHSPSSQDPTLVAQAPKLVGTMQFPAVDAAGEEGFQSLGEVVQAMGGQGAVSFDEGDYNPSTHTIYLPYSVPNHAQGTYGEVRGNFDNGRIEGTWYSNSYQPIGRFDVLRPCAPSSTPSPAPGGSS